MPFLYILKSINHPKTYVGSTNRNLSERLEEHNKGNSPFTSRLKPWRLIYSEEFENIGQARRREKYLKSAAGRSFIKKNNIIRE